MFQDSAIMGNSGPAFSLSSGRTLFADALSLNTPFRIQRLGTYLISNLFSAEYMADKAEFVHDRRLVTLCRGKELYFTGDQFDQWDLDVLLYCSLNTPTKSGAPAQVEFSPGDLLHSLNLRNTKPNRERVYASLQRLHTGAIDIRGHEYCYMTRLLNRVLVNAQQSTCLVEVNGDVTASFRNSDLPAAIRDRRSLGRNGLAKWLHGATMVFQGGFTSDIRSLYDLCRPATKNKQCFTNRLNKALDLLKNRGLIENQSLNDSTLRVVSGGMRVRDTACGMFYPGTCS